MSSTRPSIAAPGSAGAIRWRTLSGPIRLPSVEIAAGWGLVVVAGGLLLAGLVVYLTVFRGGWDDALNYLAAGERLNANHALYGVAAGDRPIDPEMQAGYSVPLISPPLVAVLWRPLAALGDPAGVAIWWLLMATAIAISIAILVRWSPLVAGLGLGLLALPLLFQVSGGNMNAGLILATVASWWAFGTGRVRLAGWILGVALVAKVIPAPLALWLLVCGGRPAISGLALGALPSLAMSIAGAGLTAHIDYAQFAFGASTIPTEFSLAGLATAYLGWTPALARYLPFAALLAGGLSIVAFRRSPGLAFAIAAITVVFGFNGVHFHSYALLMGALAPLAWRRRPRVPTPQTRERPVALATIAA